MAESKAEPTPSATHGDTRQKMLGGFSTLAVLATFLAGLQAQILSTTISDNSTLALKLVNAFWISGIFLDVFGAVLASLTARWFELLDDDECDHLTVQMATPSQSSPTWSRSYIVATALFSPMAVVGVGVALLLVGLVIYVWAAQPLLVSVLSTLAFAVLVPIVAAYFIPHADMKKDIIECLGRKRGAW